MAEVFEPLTDKLVPESGIPSFPVILPVMMCCAKSGLLTINNIEITINLSNTGQRHLPLIKHVEVSYYKVKNEIVKK
jgi:hypothetical protein